jgi:hypothetical protein
MIRDTKKICHPNTPEKLVSLFVKHRKKYHVLADRLEVNVGYVYDLIHYGKEPTKKTAKGRLARKRLFIEQVKKVKPNFIIKWSHLPTEERHKVIKSYLEHKEKQ